MLTKIPKYGAVEVLYKTINSIKKRRTLNTFQSLRNFALSSKTGENFNLDFWVRVWEKVNLIKGQQVLIEEVSCMREENEYLEAALAKNSKMYS